MSKRVLIVGGVAGGASTAARLRRLDESAEIILFERGPYVSYANCGLPYHIGGEISNRNALFVTTPEKLRGHFHIDVRVENEVTSIDPAAKTVRVLDKKAGTEYTEPYDALVLATGSSPVKPNIAGIDDPNVFTLWTVPDMDRVKAHIEKMKPRRAAVIGAGFIGLEMAENLARAGLEVTVVEMLDQVMPLMDWEMARLIQGNMVMNGVTLKLGSGVQAIERMGDGLAVRLQNGDVVETDMALLCIGVKPNSELARDAGLAFNERGGVRVDSRMRTSAPDVYAVGDVIEVDEFVTREKAMIPLAGPANKQGRICANVIAGFSGPEETYEGSLGTSIVKVFDMTAASAGLSEKALRRAGKEYGKDYFTALISQRSHAGYYPGATAMYLKLVFDGEGTILGAQIVGQGRRGQAHGRDRHRHAAEGRCAPRSRRWSWRTRRRTRPPRIR